MARKKALLLLTDLNNMRFFGGVQVYNRFLLKAFEDLDLNYRVVSMNDYEPYQPQVAVCKQRKWKFVYNVLYQLFSFRPDIVICGHANFATLCYYFKRMAPYDTICHGIDVFEMTARKIRAVGSSRKVIAVSNFTKDRVQEQLQLSPNRFYRLPPSLCTDKFSPRPRNNTLLDRWQLQQDDKIILSICRLSKQEMYKGYDTIIANFTQILKQVPNARYILCGKGDDLPRLRDMIEKQKLQSKVILAGFVPDEELVDYYNLCDVFAMPSAREGFGIVFIEAASCGKPVVAGSKDGSVDATLNGETGMLVDPNDALQITQALIDVLMKRGNENLYKADFLRQKIIDNYGYEAFRSRVAEIF